MSNEMHGYICGPVLYEFEGWFFEESGYGGPWPLNKNGERRKCAGRIWWKVWSRFDALPEAEKKKYRIGGGCQRF